MLPSLQFGGQPISVQAEQCLNARHKEASCRRCAQACPTQAITLHPPHDHSPYGPLLPQLNVEQCVHCGLCLHTCPTDVFSQSDPPEIKLAQTISNLPDAPLALVCPQHPDPATTAASVAAVVRHQRCLASLSLSQLIDLSHNSRRDLWLDDTPCAECLIGRVQPLISQTVSATNRLLQAFGCPASVQMSLNQPELLALETSPKPLFEGNQPKLSRCGLLTALGHLAQPAALSPASLQPLSNDGPVPVSQRLPHYLPASHQRLCRQLAQLGPPVKEPIQTAELPFANVKIDTNSCSACGLCARFCPTEALHFVADSQTFGISFQAATCLDCGICAVACPDEAVSFEAQLPAGALVSDKRQWLVTGGVSACAGCGQITAIHADTADNQPLCYSCREGGGQISPFKDRAGLMADLLQRLADQKH
jgi:ferredoxin